MQESEYPDIRNQIAETAEMILQTIADDGMVDLIAFADIVDLYVYFPVHLKNQDKYKSEQIQKVVNYQAGLVKVKNNELKEQLDLIMDKINQRFTKIKDAFMFFDKSQNNTVQFKEFNQALDQIKVHLSLADQ